MIHNLASWMSSIFVLYGESSEEDADIYTYVCEAIIATLINILVCLVIAFLFGRITEGIIFITAFVLLRRYAGGHHAKTHLRCITTFAVVFTCAMVFASVMPRVSLEGFFAQLYTLLIATIASMGIAALAPVEHKNKSSGDEFSKVRKWKSRGLAFALWLVCVIDFYILNIQISFILSLSMFSVFGSMAYAIIYSCTSAAWRKYFPRLASEFFDRQGGLNAAYPLWYASESLTQHRYKNAAQSGGCFRTRV